jgi:hypothetical protein
MMMSSLFEPGQVWRYRSRPGEEGSRITVAKVEAHPTWGAIVHIQVTGLAIRSPMAPGGVSRIVSHLPYQEEALRASVTEMEPRAAEPEGWVEGYRQWKTAFDADRAGVWSIPVAEAIDAMEQAISNSQRRESVEESPT